LTLKLTPNRADCLSLEGVAREVAALTGTPARFTPVDDVEVSIATHGPSFSMRPEACPRYCGRVIAGVDAAAPTPTWMSRRLERSGIRPISAVVDITNYVMLELGQPLHAFDNSRLHGAIHARMALAGEKITLLNEQTLELQDDVLLIADEQRPLAMGGMMGGEGKRHQPGHQRVYSSNRPSLRRRRLPVVPVVTALFPTRRIVSSAASISAARGARSNVPRVWFSISAAVRPGR
jgi:phenylalanyl-tRNA synthetase beta subunit